MRNEGITATLERITGDTRRQEIETERQYQSTVDRLTGRTPSIADRYTATPRPGYGSGTYTPRATATARDVVSLFIPQDAFDGSWKDFQRATGEALQWLRTNRQCVEHGGALCWGPAFELDSKPLAYRDSGGKTWYNAAIDTERDFIQAKITARG